MRAAERIAALQHRRFFFFSVVAISVRDGARTTTALESEKDLKTQKRAQRSGREREIIASATAWPPFELRATFLRAMSSIIIRRAISLLRSFAPRDHHPVAYNNCGGRGQLRRAHRALPFFRCVARLIGISICSRSRSRANVNESLRVGSDEKSAKNTSRTS